MRLTTCLSVRVLSACLTLVGLSACPAPPPVNASASPPRVAIPDPASRAPAPPPPAPHRPPEVVARFPARAGPVVAAPAAGRPVPGGGLREVAAPTVLALGADPDDAWTLPQTPKDLVVRVEARLRLAEVSLVGPDGLPWPAKKTIQDREASVLPLAPFSTGDRYRVVVQTAEPQAMAWVVVLQVEAGVDQATP